MNSRLAVIRTIIQTEDINRVLLAEKMGLSGAAITKIINPIVEQGFVQDPPYFSKMRNRKARYLSVKAHLNYVVCLRIVRKGVYSALVDVTGQIIHKEFHAVVLKQLDMTVLSSCIEAILQVADPKMHCLSCVVLSPGISYGLLGKRSPISSPFYWDTAPFNTYMMDTFGIATYWENASNAALLGEIWFGAGKDDSSVVLYNIGEGIGAAAYFDGALHRGYQNSAVEIGHVTLDEKGPSCECGNHGCLELYASTRVWEKRYNGEDGSPRFSELFSMAVSGEEKALAIVREYAQVIASGSLMLATMFAPQLMIVVSNEAPYLEMDFLSTIMGESISKRLYSFNHSAGMKLVSSCLGEDAFIMGSVPIALENYFT